MKLLLSATACCMCLFGNGQNVGIGATSPAARLSVSATGTDLAGSAMSLTLRTNAGSLPGTVGNELRLANIGFTAGGNNTSLGIRAYRNSVGTDWSTTALLLEYDVDNTPRPNGYLALTSNGRVGINTVNPGAALDVMGGDNWDLINGEGDLRVGNGSYRLKFGIAMGGGGVGQANIMQAGGVGSLGIGAGSKYLLQLNGLGFVDFQNNTGGLRINGNSGTAGQMLRSGGSAAAPAWTNMDNLFYYFTCTDYRTEIIGIANSTVTPIGGINGQSITVSRRSAVVVTCKLTPYNPDNFAGGMSEAILRVSLMSGATPLGSDGTYTIFGNAEQPCIISQFVVDNVNPGTYSIAATLVKGYGDDIGFGSYYQANGTTAANMVVQVIPK